MMRDKDQVVIVTGAASGIKACAAHLLETGRRVVAADVDACGLEEAFGRANDALALQFCDVSDPSHCAATVQAAADTYGRLDALIHWAGRHSIKTWDELTAEISTNSCVGPRCALR